MKTARLIRSLTALYAITAVGSALAAVDYEVPAEGFVSSKTRAEVRNELMAARNDGTAASSRIDGDENIGVHGSSGSRFSKPTRGEINDELIEYRRTRPGNMPNMPDDLYFGS